MNTSPNRRSQEHLRLLCLALLVSAVLALPGATSTQAQTAHTTATSVAAGDRTSSGAAKISVTVTVLPAKGQKPPVTEQDVMVFQDRERRPVVGWAPVRTENAGQDLAIMVDDSLNSDISLQFRDLAGFIRSLPPTTRVAVVYAAQGSAKVAQSFTADHAVAGKALRLPIGSTNQGSSVYMSLVDLLKHWPAAAEQGRRRAVLLISDGLDLYRGVVDSQASLNPDLHEAIDRAQRDSVTVYGLFANDAGLYRRNSLLISNGQSSLSLLATATGGRAFFQGSETPVSLRPFLSQLRDLLANQYVLTFEAQSGRIPGYARLRVTTEQRGLQLVAPERVYVPAAGG